MTARLTRPHMPPKVRSELSGFSRLMNIDRLDGEITERRLDVLGMFGPTPPEDERAEGEAVAEVDKDRHFEYWWIGTYAKEYRDSILKILHRAPADHVRAMLFMVEEEISISNPLPESQRRIFTQASYARFIACMLREALID